MKTVRFSKLKVKLERMELVETAADLHRCFHSGLLRLHGDYRKPTRLNVKRLKRLKSVLSVKIGRC